MVVSLIYGALNFMGRLQVFHRIDHPVFEKISNYIYLGDPSNSFSFNSPLNESLPDEIKTMSFQKLTPESLLSLNIDQECIFLNFVEQIENPETLKTPLEILDKKTCVFISSGDLRLKSYLGRLKPRWFYSVSETDLQKSRFLASIGLETLSPLKGDFIVIDQNFPVPKNLMAEIDRRKIVVFLANHQSNHN